jgi:PIN domain nuclease of toxin-antitoxin system
MNRIVLDASALLAILNQEPGADKLTPELLRIAASSSVNLAEVQSKLLEQGLRPEDAWEATLSPVREAVSFTPEQAKLAGALVAQTRPQRQSNWIGKAGRRSWKNFIKFMLSRNIRIEEDLIDQLFNSSEKRASNGWCFVVLQHIRCASLCLFWLTLVTRDPPTTSRESPQD